MTAFLAKRPLGRTDSTIRNHEDCCSADTIGHHNGVNYNGGNHNRGGNNRGNSTMTPQFHVFLPQMRLPVDALIERASAAEAAGIRGLALMDHLAPPMAEDQPMYEAMTAVTWLAARTERLVVGHLVLCDLLRHPALLARQAVTIDHASKGRFELGIGWGSVPRELVSFGVGDVPPGERVDRLAETLDIVSALWRGEAFDYDGKWFTLRGAHQQPVPLGRIPIVIGGSGARTMQLVAKHADWWNCPVHQLDRFERMREKAGDAKVSVQLRVTFVPSEDRRDELTAVAQRRFGPAGDSHLVGSATELVDQFAARRALGIDRFYLWFTDFAEPATLAAFGAEVISRL